ncbi:MAG: CoA transferase [Spirochaetota bacterium]|nr:CoA transferase [Spirochaetota bacterium]
MEQPLQGIRIADFSQIWAGPYATMLLSQMGAEVIKIESDTRPDFARFQSITTQQFSFEKEKSTIFHDLNLNKYSITLNITVPKGVELAKRLVALSDIAIDNFRPGVMDKLGMGYDILKEVRPDLIYLASSTRGSEGPESRYAGFAVSFAALSGTAYLNGYLDDMPHPMVGRMDLISGATAAFAIMAALVHRQKSGEGQYIDLSSTESISVLLGDKIMDYTMNQRVASPMGNQDSIMAPHNCYRCKGEDKWVSIAICNDDEWKAFCDVVDHLDWTRDERFSDAYSRKQNEKELDQLISQWTMNHTHYEVMEMLQKSGVAATPSLSSKELYEDIHLKERNFSVEVEHPVVGRQSVIGAPWELAGIKREYSASPTFGQHTDYVFSERLGLSEDEISKLREEMVIF